MLYCIHPPAWQLMSCSVLKSVTVNTPLSQHTLYKVATVSHSSLTPRQHGHHRKALGVVQHAGPLTARVQARPCNCASAEAIHHLDVCQCCCFVPPVRSSALHQHTATMWDVSRNYSPNGGGMTSTLPKRDTHRNDALGPQGLTGKQTQ